MANEPMTPDSHIDHEEDFMSEYCDHCGRKDDACSCWMLDPEWTDEVTV